LVFDGGAGFELEAGVAEEGVAGAVEGGRVVAVGDPALVGLGDGGLAAVTVIGDGDIWGGVAVIGEGEQTLIVAVGGGDSPRPSAGGEAAGGSVGVIGTLGVCILFASEQAAGGAVNPSGEIASCVQCKPINNK
jgi:hypothetical protein